MVDLLVGSVFPAAGVPRVFETTEMKKSPYIAFPVMIVAACALSSFGDAPAPKMATTQGSYWEHHLQITERMAEAILKSGAVHTRVAYQGGGTYDTVDAKDVADHAFEIATRILHAHGLDPNPPEVKDDPPRLKKPLNVELRQRD